MATAGFTTGEHRSLCEGWRGGLAREPVNLLPNLGKRLFAKDDPELEPGEPWKLIPAAETAELDVRPLVVIRGLLIRGPR